MKPGSTQDVSKWFVIKTRSLAEKKVAERLSAQGFQVYLPLLISWRIWSDRKKRIESPLIKSVVFVNCLESELKKVYAIPGILGVLTYLGKPALVRDVEIRNLQILLQEETSTDVLMLEKFEQGDEVEVVKGPLKGIFARAQNEANAYRLIIEVKSLGSGFSVSVPKSYVRKITSK